MKANRAARSGREDDASAQVIGALILFGLFVTTIAFLNVYAVPRSGLAAETEHYDRVAAAMSGLQAEAEAAALPSTIGASVARSLDLAPAPVVAKDFISFFMASPARSAGEIRFDPSYGSIRLNHSAYNSTTPSTPTNVTDVGNATVAFPIGRLVFDPHSNFRGATTLAWENGGIVETGASTPAMRFAPPITLARDPADPSARIALAIHTRVLNGSSFDVGGGAPVRVQLVTEAATLTTPATPNAESVTLRIETENAAAWDAYLRDLCEGVTTCSLTTTQSLVEWTVEGPLASGAGNDISLSVGLAIFRVSAG